MSDKGTLVAALTSIRGYKYYPQYVNVSRSIAEPNRITVTVRGDEYGGRVGSEAVATFSREEFALFLLDAAKHLTD